VAFIACVVFVASIAIAVIACFIWPYSPGSSTVGSIFETLQENPLGGLVSLDVMMVVIMPIMVLPLLGVYVALKPVNESYALIALVLGLMGNVVIFAGRPVVEMVYLSDQYAAATSEMARASYLAAGEAFHAVFGGTAWASSLVLVGISGIISSLLMLRSRVFTRATAWVGLAISVVGLAFWVPGVGALLSLLATIGGVVWYLQLARAFYRLGWGRTTTSEATTMAKG
jgi:hypothetical protein